MIHVITHLRCFFMDHVIGTYFVDQFMTKLTQTTKEQQSSNVRNEQSNFKREQSTLNNTNSIESFQSFQDLIESHHYHLELAHELCLLHDGSSTSTSTHHIRNTMFSMLDTCQRFLTLKQSLHSAFVQLHSGAQTYSALEMDKIHHQLCQLTRHYFRYFSTLKQFIRAKSLLVMDLKMLLDHLETVPHIDVAFRFLNQ